jgi:uncharacterized protein (DUF1800 family)
MRRLWRGFDVSSNPDTSLVGRVVAAFVSGTVRGAAPLYLASNSGKSPSHGAMIKITLED